MKRGYVGSPILEKIKQAHPTLDINRYFEERPDDKETGASA
jgi:hypothetical protein